MIHVIGLGVTEYAELNRSALVALEKSNWVVGSARQLQVIEHLKSESTQTKVLPPLCELSAWLAGINASESVSILASGDPLFYGIGRWFSKNYSAEKLNFYPAVSSIQVACHTLGLSLQDVEVLSLHGRPVAQIRKTLKPAQILVVLSDKNSAPQILAQECLKAGFERSIITVCENLGYPEQKVSRLEVSRLSESALIFEPLHLSVIDVKGKGLVLPSFPGIPNESFITDVAKQNDTEKASAMLTKREVRLAILSLIQANNADVIWDIGAGCGSVAVELAYWNKQVQVHAVEHHNARLACLEANCDRFGVVSQLHIIAGKAPEKLSGLPDPTKVFIGGSGGALPEILALVWQKLPIGGLLVASAVTEATKQYLFQFMNERESAQDVELETLQISVSKGGKLAGQLLYRPSLPVTLFKFMKLAEQKND
ncbi:MAG: precorrin-6Y C5,15-methyltransferase (decarboxylating) [Oleiphilaceae bacterium]